MKRTFSFFLLSLFIIFALSSCFRKRGPEENTQNEEITLVFYGLFDAEEVYAEMINDFEAQHPNVTVLYKRFLDPDQYWNLILNELAEGEGPDVFLMHNSWLSQHYRKLTPAPSELVDPVIFKDLFVEVVGNEWVFPETVEEEAVDRVWGVPLYVDSLALYYNKAHFEDAIPTQGHPSETWEGIKKDVVALNRQDQSFERFERSGIAMGRQDNILRSFDVLLNLLLQAKVQMYDEEMSKALLYQDANAVKVFDLFTSFALPSNKHYSWNRFLADPNSSEKELTTFALGKVSMIMGFSYTYENLIQEVKRLKQTGASTINLADIKIQETPQFFDPEVSKETREAYASYYAPVVSRSSLHKDLAWQFLNSMANENHLKNYFKETHRASALRSLILEQQQDPIYGVFASQVGYASSFFMADAKAYKEAFLLAVEEILDTQPTKEVLTRLSQSINSLIQENGFHP